MKYMLFARWKMLLTTALLFTQFFFNFSHSANAATASVTLAWDPAPDAAVIGYAIYFAPTTGGDTNRLDVGVNLTCRIPNLTIGVTYRIYAVSYTAPGAESTPSNQILYSPSSVPALISALTIARQSDGAMKLAWTTLPGATCRVIYASNPQSTAWTTLKTVIADGAGNATWTDSSATASSRRFYRVAMP